MWDAISESYADAARSALPLHRLLIALMGVVASGFVPEHEYKSVIESIMQVHISSLQWGEEGIFADTSIGDVFRAIGVAVAGWLLAGLLLRMVFTLAHRSLSLKVVLAQQMSAWPRQVMGFAEVKSQVEFLDALTEPVRKRLRALNNTAEFFAGLSIGLSLCAYWGGALDLALSAGGLVASIFFHVRAVNLFLSDYLGPALHRSSILGKKLPSILDVP